MNNFVKIFFVFSMIFFTTKSLSQDKNNPWQISVGTSAVNFYGTAQEGLCNGCNDLFQDYFEVDKYWNIQTFFSTASIARYADNGFSIGIRASLNKFDQIGNTNAIPGYVDGKGPEKTMITTDLFVTKAFPKLTFFKFAPFLEGGVGQANVDDTNAYTLNAGMGVDFPIGNKAFIKLNTVYRKAFENDGGPKTVYYAPGVNTHWQHNVSLAINFGGKDSDADGIYDQHDDCPFEPGLEEFNGCPDTDGDGIPDKDDSCPTTAGMAEFNGCADTDGDGIADPEDKCPDVAGLAKFGGCPDTDGDGIEDAKDACPEVAGLRRFRGCADTDGDGIADPKDKCPNEAGPADNEGCPNPTEEAIEALNRLGATVQFELNVADLKPEAIELLMSVYDIMTKFGNTNFSIEGHTDTSGPKAFNQKLSEERAEKVKSHLVEKGVDGTRLSTKGFGEDSPKVSNNTRDGRITNRRVEFKVVE
ncbi:MAG: cell envelope biogenesis protein OmpA [Flavobacteriaceae bacterium]|nr:MAG: cell envelope biogenesis protein OmpA [Flavobacteriaceae bacterium]